MVNKISYQVRHRFPHNDNPAVLVPLHKPSPDLPNEQLESEAVTTRRAPPSIEQTTSYIVTASKENWQRYDAHEDPCKHLGSRKCELWKYNAESLRTMLRKENTQRTSINCDTFYKLRNGSTSPWLANRFLQRSVPCLSLPLRSRHSRYYRQRSRISHRSCTFVYIGLRRCTIQTEGHVRMLFTCSLRQ